MRWRILLGRRTRPSADRQAAQKAYEEAREARREIHEERRPAAQALADRLRKAREENHWAERIEAAYAARRRAAQ